MRMGIVTCERMDGDRILRPRPSPCAWGLLHSTSRPQTPPCSSSPSPCAWGLLQRLEFIVNFISIEPVPMRMGIVTIGQDRKLWESVARPHAHGDCYNKFHPLQEPTM